MNEIVHAAIASAFALVMLGSGLWSSYLLASRFDPTARPSARVAATIGTFLWLLFAVFWLLLAVGAFARLPALLLLLLGALLTHRAWGRAGVQQLESDARQARAVWAEVTSKRGGGPVGVSVLLVTVIALVRTLRGGLAPPMATDTLTYHLVRAGQWVRDGTWIPEPAPDAWGYYEAYPALGDALWAWAILPGHDDSLLAFAGGLLLLALALAVHAAARSMGARAEPAILCALAICATPCVMAFVTAAYVDISSLLAFTIGVTWLDTALRKPTSLAIVPCVTGFALAAGIKLPALVPLALVGVALLVAIARADARRRDKRHALALIFAVCSIATPTYLRALVVHRNPVYPFPLSLAGAELAPGNVENTLLQTGALAPPEATIFDPWHFARVLVWPSSFTDVQHLNFGPVLPVLACIGVVLALRGLVAPRQRWVAAFLLVVVALFVLNLSSKGMLAHRTFSAPAVGRFLTIPLVAAVLPLASLRWGWLRWGWTAAVLVGVSLSWPRGFGQVDGAALEALLPRTGPVVLVAFLSILVFARRGRWRAAAASTLTAMVAVAVVSSTLRPRFRDAFYAAAVPAASFDPHPVDERAASAWPIWSWLERHEGLVVAFSTGWDGRGHNWYRAPLMGSRFQHALVYVSPLPEQRIVDYRERERVHTEARLESWARGFVEREVDIVVFGWPPPPEAQWVPLLSSYLVPVAQGADGRSIAYAIDRVRLASSPLLSHGFLGAGEPAHPPR